MPGAFKLDPLQQIKPILNQIFQLFHFYPGRLILITSDRGKAEMGKWKTAIIEMTAVNSKISLPDATNTSPLNFKFIGSSIMLFSAA